jgi:hypothetical protein
VEGASSTVLATSSDGNQKIGLNIYLDVQKLNGEQLLFSTPIVSTRIVITVVMKNKVFDN